MVPRISQVTCHTLAFELTDLVGTLLRTGSSLLTFINVLAGAISHQFEPVKSNQFEFMSPIRPVTSNIPWFAIAVKSSRSVHTQMRTTSIVFQTFILATLIRGFVLEFRTIRFLVADLGQRNAHATTAVELRLRITLHSRAIR